MKKWGKLLAVVSAVTMAAGSMAGCSASGGSQTASGTTTAAATTSAETEVEAVAEAETETEAEADSAPVVIRFGHSGTEEHQYQVFAGKFKELVEEESGGHITVEIYPNAILGNDREMIEGMLMGQQDMFVGSSTTSWVPETAVTDMPFLYRDYDHAYSCFDGFLFDELGSRFEDNGLALLGYVSIGWRNISNNVKPIQSVDDLKGMKIRVPDMEVYSATFNAMGATTVTVSLNELYMALQQGVADGQDNPASTFWAQSFQEVQKYVTLTHHMLGTNFILANNEWLNGLSGADQEMIRNAVEEAEQYQRDYLSGVEDELVENIRQAGVEVNEPEDIESFREACEGVPESLGTVPAEWIEQIKGM